MKDNKTITLVEGIKVGHYTHKEHNTGVTVVLMEEGAVGGMDIRGGATAISRTGFLLPDSFVPHFHAIALCGGSTFGLGAADGVIQFLYEKGVGFKTDHGPIPLVTSAAIYDLDLNTERPLPDKQSGYLASKNANTDPVEQGCVGAGTGATAGKFFGIKRAMKSGLGSFAMEGAGGLVVGAITVVNPLGDVLDPKTGKIIAGVRTRDGSSLLSSRDLLFSETRIEGFSSQNTVVSLVATNAILTKPEVTALARMAHAGLPRVIVPAHTMYDGDILFAAATCKLKFPELSIIGGIAAEVLAHAIKNAVLSAEPLVDLPAAGKGIPAP